MKIGTSLQILQTSEGSFKDGMNMSINQWIETKGKIFQKCNLPKVTGRSEQSAWSSCWWKWGPFTGLQGKHSRSPKYGRISGKVYWSWHKHKGFPGFTLSCCEKSLAMSSSGPVTGPVFRHLVLLVQFISVLIQLAYSVFLAVLYWCCAQAHTWSLQSCWPCSC